MWLLLFSQHGTYSNTNRIWYLFCLKLYSRGSPHCGKVYIYKKRKKTYKSPLTTQNCGTREDEKPQRGILREERKP